MAVHLPIVVDYNGKGLQRLKREFAQLDGIAAKTKFALQKALVPATAALAGLAAVTMDAVGAAIEDQKAQENLARIIRRTTGATDAQIAANEDWITTQGRLFGVTDDDLRPALAKLVRATKDVTKAQKIANLAMDVAAGTGKDLNEVTDAFAKALGGNMKSLRALAPELGTLIKDGASVDEVFKALGDTFGGSAAANADTAAGKFQTFKVRVDELKESFGEKLLPVLTDKVLPAFDKLLSWAEDNPQAFKDIALAIGAVSAAIVILNVAMWMNPWVLLVGGIMALGAAFAIAYRNSEPFREFVDGLIDPLQKIYEWAQKILGPLQRVADLGNRIRSFGLGGGGGGPSTLRRILDPSSNLPNINPFFDFPLVPFLADGGITTGPTLAMIGDNPGGREAVIPLSGPNAWRGNGGTTVNVTVQGGDPRAVVDAIVKWSRQHGKLPPGVRALP
jgi:hypothetical protein